ncbi:hypothetical protein [Aquiflexum sp.]|uniref:hypothetical protein n=1 Tax=Aquiflexum sp. TaxID=1872584 RepID=UPI003592E91B
MNFERSLLKSYGLILVFLLISISSGFSLTLPVQEKALPDICILKSLEQLNNSGNLKDANEKGKSEFKKSRQKNKNAQEFIHDDFSTFSEQEDDEESSVKSYIQLKGLLEEVDMMVGGWI